MGASNDILHSQKMTHDVDHVDDDVIPSTSRTNERTTTKMKAHPVHYFHVPRRGRSHRTKEIVSSHESEMDDDGVAAIAIFGRETGPRSHLSTMPARFDASRQRRRAQHAADLEHGSDRFVQGGGGGGGGEDSATADVS